MIIYLSLLVCIIGLIMYALSANPKVSAIGFAMFQCGLLAWLITFPARMISLPH